MKVSNIAIVLFSAAAPALGAGVDSATSDLHAKVDALTKHVQTLSAKIDSFEKANTNAPAIPSKTRVRRRLNGDVEEAPTEDSPVPEAVVPLSILAQVKHLSDKLEAIDNCVHYVDGTGTGSSSDMEGSRCYIGSFQEHQISRVVIDGFDSVSIDGSDVSIDAFEDISLDNVDGSIDIDARGDGSISISASDSIDINALLESVDVNDVMRVAATSQDDVGSEDGNDHSTSSTVLPIEQVEDDESTSSEDEPGDRL